MSFYKNGNVKSAIVDSSSQSLCNFSISYTPKAATDNSCMQRMVTGLIENHAYVVEATISWMFASFPENFSFFLQGSRHHKTNGWVWVDSNPVAGSLMRVISGNSISLSDFVKSNPTYAKRIIAEFTCSTNYDGYGVGCRCNYADGNSWVKISDVLIIPKELYVGSGGQSIKIYSDKIIGNNFVEY